MPSILTSLTLTDSQREAVTLRDKPIVVTAGAGSGKTRALVGRYLNLLERDVPLRNIVAITFTDKAAREMRARIRQQINHWLVMSTSDRERWQSALADLDAARISTIHSLCAEILRAHPAEIGLDPRFDVLEEGVAATLKAQAIESALAWASADPDAAQLFSLLSENGLRETLAMLIEQRLDADTALSQDWRAAWTRALSAAVAAFADDASTCGALDTLRDQDSVQAGGDKLAVAVATLVGNWSAFESARAAGNWDAALTALFAMRRQGMPGTVGKAGAAKDALKLLRARYDETLNAWLGGAKNTDAPPRWSLDVQIGDMLPRLRCIYDQALVEYRRLKDERRALDFDDLEAGAVQLLTQNESARQRWQSETRALLVDEFQDTNDRQRQIVYALSGFHSTLHAPPSTLFVVGDAKQSIYRFRGADVTVFRRVQEDVKQAGGEPLEFNLTFRAHGPLVKTTNALLEPILGQDDPARPYAVPFALLRAGRKKPARVREPFVEFCLGVGETAETGRAIAASALAARLIQMRDEEHVEWGEVALLFRASTTFGIYEDVLERAGIPFVTVAGRGFYDRPEIRDLLNALVAIADPADDLAMAGLLRSPAIGLSDATIYLLRWDGDKPRSLWQAVSNVKSLLSDLPPFGRPISDLGLCERAREIVGELNRWAGRATVAEVLKRFLDATGYLAMLRQVEGSARLRRNVDKLLADAHKSSLVSVGDFLEYVRGLRDVGARESEAPVEAGGAVQLMTVHKAKGLEFPIVVIADAAHERRGSTATVRLDSELGVLVAIRDEHDSRPVMQRLAALREEDREEAEDRRLLYVAATRAQEKLIVSGHARLKKDGALSLGGWLGRLGEVTGLADVSIKDELTQPRAMNLFGVACTLYPSLPEFPPVVERGAKSEEREARSEGQLNLVAPLMPARTDQRDEKTREREVEPPRRVWRVTPRAKRPTGPAWVVGKLVHEAIRRWRFPDVPDFDAFLYPHALEAGLTDEEEISNVIHEVRRLLERFRRHPLWAEMNAAPRWHELAYTVAGDTGIVDLLYRASQDWIVADFKSDEVRDPAQLAERIRGEGYDKQLRRYAEALAAQLASRPRTMLVFLDVARQVQVWAPYPTVARPAARW